MKISIFLILFALVLFHGVNNYYILTKSRYCLSPDNVYYLKRSYGTAKLFRNSKLSLNSIRDTYREIIKYSDKPPLFFVIASPFFLSGIEKNNAIMSNLIYFAILLFATYGIGKQLYSVKIGILSSFFVSMFPTVFALSRVFLVDFALMAIVALTFYLFVLNNFKNIKFSLLVGIVMGSGLLTKQSYYIFLAPILLYFFTIKDNLKDKAIIRNLIISIISGIAISFLYYAYHHYEFYHFSFQIKNSNDLFFYFKHIFLRQLLPAFSLLFLFAIFYYFKRKEYFLPTVIIITIALFSISPNKTDRFLLPIFPYIAIMISRFVYSLKKIGIIMMMILVLFSFLQFFIICYGRDISFLSKFSKYILPAELDAEFIENRGLFSVVNESDWLNLNNEIVKIVLEDISKNRTKETRNVLFIGENWRIYPTLEFFVEIRNLPIKLDRPSVDSDFLYRSRLVNKDINGQINISDFILTENINGNKWIHTSYLFDSFMENFERFKLIKTFQLPGSTFNFYEKKRI